MRNSTTDFYKILLVDDNRDGLVVRRALLEEFGHTVAIAGNGEEALRLFASGDFDVVVTDHCMPRMDGAQLIERIRASKPAARIVLLSGYVEGMGLTEASTGADIVLMKSAREGSQLLRAVKRLMTATARKPPGSQRNPPKSRASGR